jgi:hypothetical protein
MRRRRLSDFLDALARGRRPGRFQADPDDVEIVRTAITLRSARPGDAAPDKEFVSDLYEKLAEQVDSPGASKVRPFPLRGSRAVLAGVAASVVLIGGTFAATEATQSSVTPPAASIPHQSDLRTATFEAKNGDVLGQIVAYRGNPSWVFMNIGVAEPKGTILCKLQLNDGSIVSAGMIRINGGTGQLSKAIHADVNRLRGAKLFSPSGVVMASATFA